VSVSGGSCGGVDVDGADEGAELEGLLGDEDAVEDPDESQEARSAVLRNAVMARAVALRLIRPPLSRTAETLTARGKKECAGPGAPHGAWPLEAADVGTRGCRGPAHSQTL
jgi:hypothetical protein